MVGNATEADLSNRLIMTSGQLKNDATLTDVTKPSSGNSLDMQVSD